MKKIFEVKYVNVSVNESENNLKVKMPFGEMNQHQVNSSTKNRGLLFESERHGSFRQPVAHDVAVTMPAQSGLP
jgi:hypothetical protein